MPKTSLALLWFFLWTMLFMGSVFCLASAYRPFAMQALCQMLASSSFCIKLGCALLGGSVLLGGALWWLHRPLAYRLCLQGGKVDITVGLAKDVFQKVFQKHWPQLPVYIEVKVERKKQLEIFVFVPRESLPEVATQVERLEQELSDELVYTLGYGHRWFLTVLG